MKTVTVRFKLTKSTPGTYKFDEVEVPGSPLVIGSLYVKKWWFDNPPGEVELVVKEL